MTQLNRDGKRELVGEFLKLDLPQPHAIAVAAAAIGGDHQPFRFGVTLLSHGLPPSADRMDREAGGVMVRADADPSRIVGGVVDAVMKSWTLTSSGVFLGRHSRPLFLKLPPNSFSLYRPR